MTSTIPLAVKDEHLVTLTEVQRGERGLTCYTCGDKLAVKDGRGQRVSGEGRRHQARRKHFSHTSNSRCHGEGPAHYRVKTALCWAINRALKTPRERRNAHGQIDYRCPDPEYGSKDMIKFAPGSSGMNQEFELMRQGYHYYDLLRDSRGFRFDDPAGLDRAECEVWLDGRRTRADIAGKDGDGNVLWVIEIRRSGLSKAAVDHAQDKGIPLFVVDLTRLPQATEDDLWAEIKCWDYFVLAENLVRGFYPSVAESYNTGCERKAFGMGPDDHTWSKLCVYVHRGPGDCENEGCSDCEEAVLHECGEMFCPDTAYMFKHGINHLEMYTDPLHRVNSHIPPPHSESPVGLTQPRVGFPEPKGELRAAVTESAP